MKKTVTILLASLILVCSSRSAQAGDSSVSQIGPSTLYSGMAGWWTMDGKDTNWATGITSDKSGSGNNGSLIGMSTTTGTMPGKIGQALSFDGISAFASTTAINYNTQTVTFSFWGNFPSFRGSAIQTAIYSGDIMLEFDDNAHGDCTDGPPKIALFVFKSDFTSHIMNCYTPPSTNAWHNYVAVFDKSATPYTIAFYIDGVLQTSTSNTTTGTPAVQNFQRYILSVGANGPSNNQFTKGSMDDVRIYSRALSAQEVTELYNTSQSKAAVSQIGPQGLNSGLLGWWTFDGKDTNWTTGQSADKSGSGNNGFVANMSTTTSVINGKIGQAFSFNHSVANYINIPNQLAVTNNFTLSAWIKQTTPGKYGGIVAKTNSTTLWDIDWFIGDSAAVTACSGQAGDLVFFDDAVVTSNICSTSAITDTNWHHVAVVRNGTSFTFYIDGQAAGTNTIGSGALNNHALPTIIGNDTLFQGTRYEFDGTIDDVRIYSRALSVQEVQQLYTSAGGGNKVSTSLVGPQGLNSGLVNWLTFDGSKMTNGTFKDSSGNGHNALTGNIATSSFYVAGKIGQAVSFDGVDDFVSIADDPAFDLSVAGKYTWSIWVNPASFREFGTLWWQGQLTGGAPFFTILLHTSASSVWGPVTAGIATGWITTGGSNAVYVKTNDNVLKIGRWDNIVVTYDGSLSQSSRITIYVNGVDQTDPAKTDSFGTIADIAPNSLKIGWDDNAGDEYTGKADDFRFYNRLLSLREIRQLYNLGR